MPAAPLTVLGFGFVLGLRHALDVDHLAAVSTIVSQRRSLWRSSLVGALWGLGHTAALLAASAVVIGLHTEIPPRVSRGLELGVALMLIGLGLNLLRTLRAGGTMTGRRLAALIRSTATAAAPTSTRICTALTRSHRTATTTCVRAGAPSSSASCMGSPAAARSCWPCSPPSRHRRSRSPTW